MDFESPAVSRVLRRYPDVDISTLTFPSDAPEWTEQEFELFVGSGGFLKPKRRRNNGPGIQSNGAYSPRNPAFIPIDQREAQAAASSSSSSTHKMLPKRETDTPLDYAPGPVLTTPGVAVLPELPLTTWHEGAYWAPSATYMEDVDENGMRLVAALNKCERFRNVGLKKGAGFTLNALKEKFGAGILLREFAMEVLGEIPSNIMSLLWVSLRLELPCSPFMPMYQVMVPEGRQKAVCKGVFGMLMLDTATMSVLNDNKIYEEVAEPLRKAFSLKKPDGSEGVPKFPRIYPGRGSPFRPLQVMSTTYTVRPNDCDMYRVIFHPQMVSVCEKVNYAVGLPFGKQPPVAIYANLAKPAGVDDTFNVRIYIEPPPFADCLQHRVLYLFSVKGAGVMTAFVIYGPPPGELFSEDISACAAPKFAALENFAATTADAPSADRILDLTRCSKIRR